MKTPLIEWDRVREGARGAAEGFLGVDDDRRAAATARGYMQAVREGQYIDDDSRRGATDTQKAVLALLGLALVGYVVRR